MSELHLVRRLVRASLGQTDLPERTEEERAYYSFQRRAWTLFAPCYDAVVFPFFRRLRREVAGMVDVGPGARVLDVATGTGAQAFALATKARQVVGIDMSEAMLRIARRKNRYSNVLLLQADAVALPFGDETFDASCVSFALHEMPAGIRARVVREMARVTRVGGPVLVVDYALPRHRLASSVVYHAIRLYEGRHYATFVKSDVAALLESAGIEVAEQRVALAGVARIVAGRRREAPSSASSRRAP